MSSITAAKLDGVGVGRPGTRREYVRKDGGEAYAYVSSYLVLLEHGGHSVRGEGIDGQATRVEEACICESARIQHVFWVPNRHVM